jgi:hypothetical protein
VVCSPVEPSPGLIADQQEDDMAKGKQFTLGRLNAPLHRKQQRDLRRRLAGNDPGLTIVHSHAGGIDVGSLKTARLVAYAPFLHPKIDLCDRRVGHSVQL